MNVWVGVLLLGLITEIPEAASDSTCQTNKPESFLDYDIGEDSLQNDLVTSYQMLGTYQIPFLAFGLYSPETDVELNTEGSLLLSPSPSSDFGGLSIRPYHLPLVDNWFGTFYYRYSDDDADLTKINSYVCDFSSESALIFTFSCLSRDAQTHHPEADYQVVVAYGQGAGGTYQTIVFIIYDFVQLQSDPDAFVEFTGVMERYPLAVNNDTVLAINVTSTEGFVDQSPPPTIPTPCVVPTPATSTVRCSVTADGVLTTFDDQQITAPDDKVILAEWNPGVKNCKFKLQANFQGHYRWTSMAVGPHKNERKFFRYIDFDRIDGKLSQRGWKCQQYCKGVINSFNHDIGTTDGSIVYATVKEVDPGIEYVIDSEVCSGDLQPDYRFTYDFGAASGQPVAVLEIDGDFYDAYKHDMAGHCVGNS